MTCDWEGDKSRHERKFEGGEKKIKSGIKDSSFRWPSRKIWALGATSYL